MFKKKKKTVDNQVLETGNTSKEEVVVEPDYTSQVPKGALNVCSDGKYITYSMLDGTTYKILRK
jgi:hypothetical protein